VEFSITELAFLARKFTMLQLIIKVLLYGEGCFFTFKMNRYPISMWCWRRMEKITWTDDVRNEEVLLRVSEQRNILHEIRKRKASWIGCILRRSCRLKHIIEGIIEAKERCGRRCKQLLDGLEETRRYWKLKEEAVDRAAWRTRLGRGYGPVVRMSEW
jgi:hypothetical protein